MIGYAIKKIFGSRNDRIISQLNRQVDKINRRETGLSALSDEALKAKTDQFREQLAAGATLSDIRTEAFAVVREAAKRVLEMRHFDVQLTGAMVLDSGKIAEMSTGEGKTLAATPAIYLNALTGKGVHLITVNDYLAKRDAEQMGKLYAFLGMTTGVVVPGMSSKDKRAAYQCDITYGTNNEFGFDYLRDNMAFSTEEQVQRPLHFAVVDEVDSVLIDEARTPLVISGSADDSSNLYEVLTKLAPKLTKRETEDGPGDYTLDEKSKQVYLTEDGHQHIESLMAEAGILEAGESLYSAKNVGLMHYLNAVLRANFLFHRDVDYMLQDDEVMIVDEHTGRAMSGRRWSDGLHQAIEAKEGVRIQSENQTLASITFQNYFRLYEKLSGMTGTADTEAYEFHQIYNLEVVVIPTNKPMIRDDKPDVIFLTAAEKYEALVKEVQASIKRGQPVLVGTASIETSELISGMLTAAQVDHQVLNAKAHAKEATVIAQAGLPGNVTIATNMAGRGTDIILGGNPQLEIDALTDPDDNQIAQIKSDWRLRHERVLKAGGLYIIGSERHESRRIDNQLRGRAGRQGDPGASRFYLSLEDPLVRIFASERVSTMMRKLGMGKGEALESRMLTRAIENAQRKVEGHNFDIRKQLLEYDNVANDQRQVIYAQRRELLESEAVDDVIERLFDDVIIDLVAQHLPQDGLVEDWDIPGLTAILEKDFSLKLDLEAEAEKIEDLSDSHLENWVLEAAKKAYLTDKRSALGPEVYRSFEKTILLQSLDNHWREHLANMDHLRHTINLRGYAQKDPKQEYKRESFNLFSDMLDRFRYDVVSVLSLVEIELEAAPDSAVESQWRGGVGELNYQHGSIDALANEDSNATGDVSDETASTQKPFMREGKKIGRNDPCPCNSGKKYKHCHGQVID